MKPRLCTPKKIAVIVTASGMAGRDYLSGVFRYVNTKTQWMLELFNNVEECLRWQKQHGKPDGVISLLPHDRDSLCALLKANIPTVIVDTPLTVGRFRTDKTSFIQLNDEAIGSAAAEHLLSRGRFNSFACLIDEPYFKYPFCREQGFRNRLAKAGESVKTIILPEKNATNRDVEAFDLTIARLPRYVKEGNEFETITYTAEETDFTLWCDGEVVATTNSTIRYAADKVFGSPDEPTDISFVALDQMPHDGRWYTISGILLPKKPVSSGLYIHNGKVVKL